MKKKSILFCKAALLFCCLTSIVGLTFAQTTYTFSNYPAGDQYAVNEVHVLDDAMTIVTNECHFTTQLRVYSSSSHDGYFYSHALPLYIDSIAFNMGYKVDNVNIYGSIDGDNWNLVGTIAVTSTNYTNYGLSFGNNNYNYFKFDVAGNQQIRVVSMTMFYKSTGPAGQVAQIPTFSPAAGLYTAPISVSIASETANTSIYYTLDGTTPTTSSTLYTAPFTISQTTTVKAIATAAGYANSSVATATYSFPEIVANLAAFKALPDGSQPYIIGNDVTFVFSNGTYTYVKDASAGLLLYGNNGIVDDFAEGEQIANLRGSKTSYHNQIEMTVSAYEVSSSPSIGAVNPITLTINELKNNYATYDAQLITIENVTFPDGFTGSTCNVIHGTDTLSLYNRFAIDTTLAAGSTHNITGFAAIYNSTVQLYPRTNQDLDVPSSIITPEVAAPVFSPAAGTYTDSVTFSITCATDGATIYYTTDGSEPTETSTLYSAPITLTTTTTVNAKAFKTDWIASPTATAVYVITSQPVSNDSVIYAVGFEDEEGFTASNVYNNTTVAFTGADGAQWGTYYGTPSTNSHIAGNQSMQMRWYTSAPENIGYTYTNFDLHNVTHVTFAATSTNDLNVNVSHSVDGGNTYSTGETFTLGTTASTFDYVVDEDGSYNFVRLKFTIVLPGTNPNATSRVVIDSLVVFGVPGVAPSIVTTPVISPNNGTYYTPQTVTITCADDDAVIRYTTDGTEPTENSTVYSQPFTVNTTTTIMAKAWKDGMTPSLVASATVSFPQQVANIAAFKAEAATNEERQIMSNVTFVFRSGRFMFVEDNTAALLIYDYNTPVITTQYNEGDVIEGGIFGKYTTYQGMVEMLPTNNANDATGTPVTVTPANATITDIKAQYADVYEAKLVHLSNVEFINATTFVQNGDTMAIYNRFNTVTTDIAAGDLADVTGFVSYSDSYGYQIYPRGNEDIEIHPVVIMDTVATPVFDLFKDGEFYRVNITCATEDATIYYTLNGTDPDESSNLFTDLFPLPLTVHYTLKAIAMKEGMVNSAIAVYDYNPSSICSYELRDNLSIYPNPATDAVFIDSKDKALIERVELFNAFGQLIRSVEVGNAKAEISVSEFATGTYFAKVFTDKGVATLPVIRK